MGFKKGRAARAKANIASDSIHEIDTLGSDSFNIRHDGGSCLYYRASNGSEYKIDLATMTQTNVCKGTQRAVYRQPIKTASSCWTMWQFEARRNGHRLHMRSQYPKWVGFALNERWQSLAIANNEENTHRKAFADWNKVVNKLDDAVFASVFDTLTKNVASLDQESEVGAVEPQLNLLETLDDAQIRMQLIRLASKDVDLQHVLFDRIVVSKWSPIALANAMRWLLQQGFQASGTHCRKIALYCGSVTALRVLLVEANVNVCGLELLESGTGSLGKSNSVGNGGWVQHSKLAVKLLLARGASLGDHASRSKLLKRLECDGHILWATRVLDAIGSSYSNFVFPDFVLQVLEDFLGIPHEKRSED